MIMCDCILKSQKSDFYMASKNPWNGILEWPKSQVTYIWQYHPPLSRYESYIMHQLHKNDLLHLISILLLVYEYSNYFGEQETCSD